MTIPHHWSACQRNNKSSSRMQKRVTQMCCDNCCAFKVASITSTNTKPMKSLQRTEILTEFVKIYHVHSYIYDGNSLSCLKTTDTSQKKTSIRKTLIHGSYTTFVDRYNDT